MQDQVLTPPLLASPRHRTGRRILIGLLILLLASASLTAWLMWRGTLAVPVLSWRGRGATPDPFVLQQQPSAEQASATPSLAPPAPIGAAEERLALLEDRLSRLDLQAQAASGNAARAEGLLIAFAARRMIDRGAPLGYLEDQLKLRFADAQPNAVQTLIDAAKTPVTLDLLMSQLDALGPALAGAPKDEDAWTRMKRELSGLFVIHRETTPSATPEARIDRARLMLAAGKTGEAVAEVERLPGAAAAQRWIASARRYDTVHRALDLIETTAMLEPRRLQDSQGAKVQQPSPLAPPGPSF